MIKFDRGILELRGDFDDVYSDYLAISIGVMKHLDLSRKDIIDVLDKAEKKLQSAYQLTHDGSGDFNKDIETFLDGIEENIKERMMNSLNEFLKIEDCENCNANGDCLLLKLKEKFENEKDVSDDELTEMIAFLTNMKDKGRKCNE